MPGCFTGLICYCDPTPTPIIENGMRVFHDQGGRRGIIVVEARRGTNNRAPGSALSVQDPCVDRPSLEIQANQDLGDGSPILCGSLNPPVCEAGIPAIQPPSFGGQESVTAAINEFACHFGSVTAQADACTQNQFGAYGFLGGFNSTQQYRQYCYNLTTDSLLPIGDTTFTVRVLDTAGTPGPTAQIKIRVATPTPPH